MLKWTIGILFAIIVGVGIGAVLDMRYKETPVAPEQQRQFHLDIQFRTPNGERVHHIEVDTRKFGVNYGSN